MIQKKVLHKSFDVHHSPVHRDALHCLLNKGPGLGDTQEIIPTPHKRHIHNNTGSRDRPLRLLHSHTQHTAMLGGTQGRILLL